jgi:hypothetical protein
LKEPLNHSLKIFRITGPARGQRARDRSHLLYKAVDAFSIFLELLGIPPPSSSVLPGTTAPARSEVRHSSSVLPEDQRGYLPAGAPAKFSKSPALFQLPENNPCQKLIRPEFYPVGLFNGLRKGNAPFSRCFGTNLELGIEGERRWKDIGRWGSVCDVSSNRAAVPNLGTAHHSG